MRRVIIMGAGGRDFHDFNVLYRDDPGVEVVAFTATQIPGIADRTYPPSLAGPRYPDGIPIVAEEELVDADPDRAGGRGRLRLLGRLLPHVMHRAAIAAGRRRRLHAAGPGIDDAREREAGGRGLRRAHRQRQEPDEPRGRPGPASTPALRVGADPPPDALHDLERCASSASPAVADIDASHPTIEEREEYERPVEMGIGRLRRRRLRRDRQARGAGGRRDRSGTGATTTSRSSGPTCCSWSSTRCARRRARLPPRRGEPAHGRRGARQQGRQRHGGAASAGAARTSPRSTPTATVIQRRVARLARRGPAARGAGRPRVEDGPTITHGGMPLWGGDGRGAPGGRGTRRSTRGRTPSARSPRPSRRYPHIGPVLPAMGYSDDQLRELEETINATECDVVITGTPIDLGRLIDCAPSDPPRHL